MTASAPLYGYSLNREAEQLLSNVSQEHNLVHAMQHERPLPIIHL